ncbi:MFS transporter [uncultured Modestobacter sp.]|uniref:MFS transporter n=1 Tax=uncultured Modestobacter sp. TaxID=380048 RepID=UPI00260B5435|nr:MFS transporter [uncultured Modestobacter sp.]
MSDSPAPRARRRLRAARRAPEHGVDTSPMGVRRQQTRPLPVAASQPPGDDTPTAARPVAAAQPTAAQPTAGQPTAAQPPVAAGPTLAATTPAPGAHPPSGPAAPGPRGPKVTVTRVAAARTRELGGAAVRRVRAAGRADGAGDSGLSGLVWVNALHVAGDAMIAVSLAGTLFFAAAADAQRSNVALYLLVTMAPFALVAPVIGPALDRLQRGRRWALSGSLAARAVLALLMAAHHDDLALYPAALGVLVLSKGFNVLRAAVVPRVLPGPMSLTSANARLSVFGLAAGGVLGAVGAGIAALLGFGWELGATAVVFTVAAVLAVRLPSHVDVPAGEEAADVLRTAPIELPGRRRATTPHVVTALRATAALRGLGGFLTIFSAFLVQATVDDGWAATVALGSIAVAAGAGSFLGTAAGSRLHTTSPDKVVLAAAGVAAAITVLAAFTFSLPMAALVAGVAAIANGLGKSALDAIIQREVPDRLRASAFARSETWLQLAWVVGGALGVALPTIGWLGFTVAAALLVLAIGLTLWSLRTRRTVRTIDREA